MHFSHGHSPHSIMAISQSIKVNIAGREIRGTKIQRRDV